MLVRYSIVELLMVFEVSAQRKHTIVILNTHFMRLTIATYVQTTSPTAYKQLNNINYLFKTQAFLSTKVLTSSQNISLKIMYV